MHSGKQLHFTLEYSSFKQAFQSQCSSLPADAAVATGEKMNKKAVLPRGNRAMPQVFFSVEVRQQHSLQV